MFSIFVLTCYTYLFIFLEKLAGKFRQLNLGSVGK